MWTTDNTEGFTQDQLDMINRVRAHVQEHAQGGSIPAAARSRTDAWHTGAIDWSNIDDAINNCWSDGISEDELEADVLTCLGL